MGFFIGVLAVAFVLAVVVLKPSPTAAQFNIFRTVIALGGAAFGMSLTGFVVVRLPIPGKGFVLAGGTLALFVVLYFFNPAGRLAGEAATDRITMDVQAETKKPWVAPSQKNLVPTADLSRPNRASRHDVRVEMYRIHSGGGSGTGEQPTLDLVLVNDGPSVLILKSMTATVLSGNQERCAPMLSPSSKYFIDISRGEGTVVATNEIPPNRAERILVDLFRGCACCTTARIRLKFAFSSGPPLATEIDLP